MSDQTTHPEKNSDSDEYSDQHITNCSHYIRDCELLYPCCNEFYQCRFCHDDHWDSHTIPDDKRHCADRKLVNEMRCKYCETVQPINDHCIRCTKIMGNYFCVQCKLLDLVDKGQFHCDKCGICRQGGVENFEHCEDCGICFHKGEHDCMIKLDSQDQCPVCCVELFDSVIQCRKMKCGHWIHVECFNAHIEHNNKCPICSKSIIVSELYNQYIRDVIAENPMPEEYEHRDVRVLCNDCNVEFTAVFHFIGHQCPDCSGFNTKLI